MLVLWIQSGNRLFGPHAHRGPASLLGPLVLLLAGAAFGAVLLPTTRWAVTHVRAWRAARRARRRAEREAATAELRARAMMSELCPFGWHAQITVFGGGPALETENGPPRGQVALDWTELSGDRRRPAVMRRVWADSIAAALVAMVADRRTDETLEQIEHGAAADGALWPDL